MLLEAPAAILVCGDSGLLHYDGYMSQDLSAATQNILVAARDSGLATVWLGIHPEAEREEGCRRLLSIPQGVTPFSLIAVGYSTVTQGRAKRYREDRVHRNGWA